MVQVEDKNKQRAGPLKRNNFNPIKNKSISPHKEGLSPKKDMFRSLYGNSFIQEPRQEKGHLLSTLGMSNWRGRHKSLNKKEVEQRDKNKKQYQEVLKYENVINQRFDNKINSMRVEGIKDKIHDRN